MRAAATLLLAMLTAMTAWADVQTVTYTIGYKSGHGYYLTGDDGTQSAYFRLTGSGLSTVTLSLGSDVTFRIVNPHNERLEIGTFQDDGYGFLHNFDTDVDVTVTSASRYVAYMKLVGWGHENFQEVQIPQEVHNDQKSCTMEWRNVHGYGNNVGGVGKFVITYSTTQYAYRLRYFVEGSEVNGHGNPAYYESATETTLTCFSKKGYNFDGWHENDDYTGSAISSIAAGTKGEKTFYARWSLITYSISYELNGGSKTGEWRSSYNVTSSTYNLNPPIRDGYYFRGWFEEADFAGYPVTKIYKGSTGNITLYAKWEKWDENGDGTRWNPYKIKNEADLRALATKVNGGNGCKGVYYQQTCDITITGGDWTPIGDGDHDFSGNYDGGNYTISGITIETSDYYQGLFGNVSGTRSLHYGFIQNIILENSSIHGGSFTGGIVGSQGYGCVRNCHVRSSVTVKSTSILYTGGIVGYYFNGTISNCSSMATLSTGSSVGGIIGYMKEGSDYTATATNCFSYGIKPIGNLASGTATNVARVYRMRCTDGSVTLPDVVDKTDGFYYNGIGYYKEGTTIPLTLTNGEPPVGYELVVKDGSTVVTPNEDGEYIYTTPGKDRKFTATTHVSPLLGWTSRYTPDGTTNPYVISSTEGWNLFCDCLAEENNTTWNHFSGKTVKLDEDIDVIRKAGGSDHTFSGTFDGQGKTLYVNITGTVQGTAPFCEIKGATIRNLVVTGSVAGKRHSAGLVGFARGDASVENTIENCLVATDVSIKDDDRGYLGGIVGHGLQCKLTIRGCAFTGSLTSESYYTGGLQGWSDGNTLILTDDLFAPTSVSAANVGFHPIAIHANNATTTATVSNVYYTVEPTCTAASRIATTSAAEQPKQAYVYTPATIDFVPANVGEATGNTYDVSDITLYESGMKQNGKFYLVKGSVSLADDAVNDIALIDKLVADVTFSNRTLYKDGSWNTLCLPFDLTLSGSVLDGDNVELMTLGDASFSQGTLSLSFVVADEIKAGKPYIIRWNNTGSHIVNPVFKGVTIVNASLDENAATKNDVISFKGIYSPFEITEANNKLLYLGDDNQVYYPSAAMTINAFRAYFELQGDLECGEPSSTDNGINAFVLNFDGETTSIDQITIDHSPLTIDHEAWYDLSGRMLSGKPTAKGIYIKDGKTYVIK